MSIVCPSCDKLPPADLAAGAPCPACRTPLVEVSVGTGLGAGLDIADVAKVDDSAFGPPPETVRPIELALDPEWVAQRAAKQAAAAAPPRRRSPWGVIVALVLVIAVTIAVVWIVKRDPVSNHQPRKSSKKR